MNNKKAVEKGKEYELLTKEVYIGLLKRYPGAKVELLKKIIGKSGAPRVIDIYAEIPIGPHTYKTAIECKNYSNTVGIDEVAEFYGKLEDLNIEKVIIVTKSGFSPQAKQYAKEHGLDLIELRKPNEEDWDGRVKTIKIQMDMYYPIISKIELKTDKKEMAGKQMAGLSNKIVLVDEKGKTFKDMNTIIQENLKNNWDEEEKLVDLRFDKKLFLKSQNDKIPVKGITFKYSFRKAPREILIDGERTVELILKDVFTGEIITIDKNFKISNKK